MSSAAQRSARRYFAWERRRAPLGAALRKIVGGRVADAAHALYAGVWLGLLDDDRLAAITQAYYAEQGGEWRHTRWTEVGLKPWEEDVVARFLSGRPRVMIGCAGAGREAFALARRGFAVSAFDCSPSLLGAARAYAERHGLTVEFTFSAPDHVPDLGPQDAAIVGWGGIMHVIGSSRRAAFLRRFREHLPAGAPLLVSFYVRPERDPAHAATIAVAPLVRTLRRRTRLEPGDELRPRFYRHRFTRGEIEEMFSRAGFELAEISLEHEYAVGVAS